MSTSSQRERKGHAARPPQVLRIRSSGECYAVTFGAQIYAEVTGAAPLALYSCTSSEAVLFHRKQGGGSEDLHEVLEEGCALPGAIFAAAAEKDGWVRVAGGATERWFPLAEGAFTRLDTDVSKSSHVGDTGTVELPLAWHPWWEVVSWQACQGAALKTVIAGFDWGAEAAIIHDVMHSRFLRIGTKRSSKPGVVLGDIEIGNAHTHELVAAARSAAAGSGDAVLITRPMIGVSWGADVFDVTGLWNDVGYVSAASTAFATRQSDRELESDALAKVQQALVAEVRGWFSPTTTGNAHLRQAAAESASALRAFWGQSLRDQHLLQLWDGLSQLSTPTLDTRGSEAFCARLLSNASARDNPREDFGDPMSIWVQITLGSLIELASGCAPPPGEAQHKALERIIERVKKTFAASRPLSLCNTGSTSEVCIREMVVALGKIISETPELKPTSLDMVLTLATSVGSATLIAHALKWVLHGAGDECGVRCGTTVSSLWQLGSSMHFEKCTAPGQDKRKNHQNLQFWKFVHLSSCSTVVSSPVWIRSYRLLSFDDTPRGVYWEVTVLRPVTSIDESPLDLSGVSVGLWLMGRKKPLACSLADGSVLGPGVQDTPMNNIPRVGVGGSVFGFLAKSEELIVSCDGKPFSTITYKKLMTGERVALFVEKSADSRVLINIGQEPAIHLPDSGPMLWGHACDPVTGNPFVPFEKPPQTAVELVDILFRILQRNVGEFSSFVDNAALMRHTFTKTDHMEIAEDGSVVSSMRERSWARVDCEISVGMSVEFTFEVLDDRENDEGTCYGLSTLDCNKYDSRGSFCLRSYNGHMYCDSSDTGAKFPKIHPGSMVSFRFDYSEGKLEASLNDGEPRVLVDDPNQFAGRSFYPTVFNYHGTRTKVRLHMCNTCGSLRASVPDPFVLEVTIPAAILWIDILEQLIARYRAAPFGSEIAKQVSTWIAAALHVWLAIANVSPDIWFDLGIERARLKKIIEYVVIEQLHDPILQRPREIGILVISALGVGVFFGDLARVLQVFLEIHDVLRSKPSKLSQTLATHLLGTRASAMLSGNLVVSLCKLAVLDDVCCHVLMRLMLNAFTDGECKFQIFADSALDLIILHKERLVQEGNVPSFISDLLPILAQLLAVWPKRKPSVLPNCLELLRPVAETQSVLRAASFTKPLPKYISDAMQGLREFICGVAKILLAEGEPFPFDISDAELRDCAARYPLPEELVRAKDVVDHIAGCASVLQVKEPHLPHVVAEILDGVGEGQVLLRKLHHEASSSGKEVINKVQVASFALAVLCKGPKLWDTGSADATNPAIQTAWQEARIFWQSRVLPKKRSVVSSGGDGILFEANVASMLRWLARSVVWPLAGEHLDGFDHQTLSRSADAKVPMVERMRQLGRMYAVDDQALSGASHDLSKVQAQLVDEAAKAQAGSDATQMLASAASLQRDRAFRRWLAFRLLRHLLRQSTSKQTEVQPPAVPDPKKEDDGHRLHESDKCMRQQERHRKACAAATEEISLLMPGLQGALEECLANPLAGLAYGGTSHKHAALVELRGLLTDIYEACANSSKALVTASGLLMLCVPLPREELDLLVGGVYGNLIQLALDTTGRVSWCRAHAAQLVLRMYIVAKGCQTPLFLELILQIASLLETLSEPVAELPRPHFSCSDPLEVDWDFGAFGRLCPQRHDVKMTANLNDLHTFRVQGKFSSSLAASLLLRLPIGTMEANIDPLNVAHAIFAECSETAEWEPGAAELAADWPTKCRPGACAAALTLLRPVADVLLLAEPNVVGNVLKVISSGERFPASLAACFYASLRNQSKPSGDKMPCAEVSLATQDIDSQAAERAEAQKLLELLGESRRQAMVRDDAASSQKRHGALAFATLLASKLRQIISERSEMVEVILQALAGVGSDPTSQALAALTLIGGTTTCVACHMHVMHTSLGPSLVIGADAKHVTVLKLESGGDAKAVQFIRWAALQASPRRVCTDIRPSGIAGEGTVHWGQNVTKSLLAAVHRCISEDSANHRLAPQLVRALTAALPSAPCWDALLVKQVFTELAELAAVGVGDAMDSCIEILEDHCMLLRLALQREGLPSSVWQSQSGVVTLDPLSWKPPMLRILNQGHSWHGSCKVANGGSDIELWFTFHEEGLLDVVGKWAHDLDPQSGQNSKWYHSQGEGVHVEFDMEVVGQPVTSDMDHMHSRQSFTWQGCLANSSGCPHFEGSARSRFGCFPWYCVPPDPLPLANATDLHIFGESKYGDEWLLNLPQLQHGFDQHQMEHFRCTLDLPATCSGSACSAYGLAKAAVDGLETCTYINGPKTMDITEKETAQETWGLRDHLDEKHEEDTFVISQVTGTAGSYVEHLSLLMQDGTSVTYGNETSGEALGPWTLQPDEYITAVEQGDLSSGTLGACLILETSRGNRISVSGNGDDNVSDSRSRMEAPLCSQVIGLNFEGGKLTKLVTSPVGHFHRKLAQIKSEVLGGGTCLRPSAELTVALEDEEHRLRHAMLMRLLQIMLVQLAQRVIIGESFPVPRLQEAFFRWAMRLPDPRSVLLQQCIAEFRDSKALLRSALTVAMEGILAPFLAVTVSFQNTMEKSAAGFMKLTLPGVQKTLVRLRSIPDAERSDAWLQFFGRCDSQGRMSCRLHEDDKLMVSCLEQDIHVQGDHVWMKFHPGDPACALGVKIMLQGEVSVSCGSGDGSSSGCAAALPFRAALRLLEAIADALPDEKCIRLMCSSVLLAIAAQQPLSDEAAWAAETLCKIAPRHCQWSESGWHTALSLMRVADACSCRRCLASLIALLSEHSTQCMPSCSQAPCMQLRCVLPSTCAVMVNSCSTLVSISEDPVIGLGCSVPLTSWPAQTLFCVRMEWAAEDASASISVGLANAEHVELAHALDHSDLSVDPIKVEGYESESTVWCNVRSLGHPGEVLNVDLLQVTPCDTDRSMHLVVSGSLGFQQASLPVAWCNISAFIPVLRCEGFGCSASLLPPPSMSTSLEAATSRLAKFQQTLQFAEACRKGSKRPLPSELIAGAWILQQAGNESSIAVTHDKLRERLTATAESLHPHKWDPGVQKLEVPGATAIELCVSRFELAEGYRLHATLDEAGKLPIKVPNCVDTVQLISYPQLIRGSTPLLQRVDMTPEYEISFDLKPHSKISGLTSILRFTTTEQDNSDSECDRIPAFFFCSATSRLHVRQDRPGHSNDGFDSRHQLPLGKTTRIRTSLRGKILAVFFDDVLQGECSNYTSPLAAKCGVKVWVGDQFHEPADATIDNLVFCPVLDGAASCPKTTELNELTPDMQVTVPSSTVYLHGPVPRVPQWDAECRVDWMDDAEGESDAECQPMLCAGPWTWALSPEHQVTVCLTPSGGVALTSTSMKMMAAAAYDEARGIMTALGEAVIQPNVGWVDPDRFRLAMVRGSWDVVTRRCLKLTLEGTDDLGTVLLNFSSSPSLSWDNDVAIVPGEVEHVRWGQHSVVCNGATKQAGKVSSVWKRPKSCEAAVEVQILGTSKPATAHGVRVSTGCQSIASPEVGPESQIQQSLILNVGEHVERVSADVGCNGRPFRFIVRTNRGRSISWPMGPPSGTPLIEYAPPAYCEVIAVTTDVFTGSKKLTFDRAFRPLDLVRGRHLELQSLPEGLWAGNLSMDGTNSCEIGMEFTAGSSCGSFAARLQPLDASRDLNATDRGTSDSSLCGQLGNSSKLKAFYTSRAGSPEVNLEGRCVLDHLQRVVMVLSNEVLDDSLSEEQPRLRMILRSHVNSPSGARAGAVTINDASLIFRAHWQASEYVMHSAASAWTRQVATDGLLVAGVVIQHLSPEDDGSGLVLGLAPAQQLRPEPLPAWPGSAKKMQWLWRGDGSIAFHTGTAVGYGQHERSIYEQQCERWRFGEGDVAGFAISDADVSFVRNGERVHTVPRHAFRHRETFSAEGNPTLLLGVSRNAAVKLCGGLQYPLLHQDLQRWQTQGTKMHAQGTHAPRPRKHRITLRQVALALIWLSRLIRMAFKGWMLWKQLPAISDIADPVAEETDEDVWIEATVTGTEGSPSKGTTMMEELGGEDALREQLATFYKAHNAQAGVSSSAEASVEVGEVFVNQLGPSESYPFTEAAISAYCKRAADEQFLQFCLKHCNSGWRVTSILGENSGKRNLCEGMHIKSGEQVTALAVDGDWLKVEASGSRIRTLWFPIRGPHSAQCRFIRKRDFTFNEVPVAWSIGTVHLEDWVTPESLEGNIHELPIGDALYTVEASVRVDTCASDTEMCLVAWGADALPCIRGLSVLDQAPATASGSLRSPGKLQDGQWHHIACTFDGRERRLWSNFELVASDLPDIDGKAKNTECSVMDNFSFGAYPPGLAAAQGDPGSFHGDVRHLRIWKTVLGPGILRENALASESPERQALCVEAATVLFKCLDASEDGRIGLGDLEVIFGNRSDHFLEHLHHNAEGLSSLEDWLAFCNEMRQCHGEHHLLNFLRGCLRNFMQQRPPTVCSNLSPQLKEVIDQMSPSSRCFGWRVLAKPVGVNSSTMKYVTDERFKTFSRQVHVVHSLFGSSLDEAIVEIADKVSVLRGNHDNCWLKPLSVAEWSKADQRWIDQAVRHHKLENLTTEEKLQQVLLWAAVSGSSLSDVLTAPVPPPEICELWATAQSAIVAALDEADKEHPRSNEALTRNKLGTESSDLANTLLTWLGTARSVVGSVSQIIGHMGPTAVECLELRQEDASTAKVHGSRASGGSLKALWTLLEPQEFIVAVSQGDPDVGHLGSSLIFETSHRRHQLQASEGNGSEVSARFEAAAGEQIHGLVFEGSRLTGVETCPAAVVTAEATVDALFCKAASGMLFYRFLVLLELNRNVSRDLLPLIDLSAPAASANGRFLSNLKPRLFGHLKFARFQRVLERTKVDGGSTPHIMVNRKMAAALRETARVDWEFKRSVLAQLMIECRKNSSGPKLFRRLWQSRFMRLSFKGEGGEDAGGLYREALDTVAQELQSKAVPLLVPCPNSVHEVGDNRDAWILNPRATTIECVHALEFVGQLLGLALRTGDLLPLSLAPFTWKGIIGDERTRDDVRSIDVFAEKDCDAEKHLAILGGGGSPGQGSAEVLAAMGGLQFVYPDVTGEEVELVQGGRGVDMTVENAHEFARLLLQSRLSCDEFQLQALRRGLASVVPAQLLRLWSWQNLQERVCGALEVDLENLKRHTQYRSCSGTDKHVGFLWGALQSFTPKQQRSFLRFVWGRSSLPTVEKWEHNFTVHLVSCSDDSRLPSSHTCVFTLELPTYSSAEVCRAKLLYCITNCLAIDSDGNAARSLNWDEDDWD